ncbi:MAG: NAD(P)H-hydrate dehydratase [Bacteroidia bacterium]|nr:NAD(P)H-hydrate dehydratase [Bacteroidia bacterium]
MKILTAEQTRWLDRYTIENEPIESIDLMERACEAFVHWIEENIPSDSNMLIFAGPGNNGGDALGIARLLHQSSYPVVVVLCQDGKKISKDCAINLKRAEACDGLQIIRFEEALTFVNMDYIIDGIFGSGLTRAIEFPYDKAIEIINQSKLPVISIDIPSGLQMDQVSSEPICRARFTITFQLPKLALLLPQNDCYVGTWHCVDIGLSQGGIAQIEAQRVLVDIEFAKKLYRPKRKYDHKGTNGRSLLISGSSDMPGAAVLNTKGCLRSGSGLVTLYSIPSVIRLAQQSIPEILSSIDQGVNHIITTPDLNNFDSIGVGSGLGTHAETANALREMLRDCKQPLVIDADALNIIAQLDLVDTISRNSIITPHPREFERLFGSFDNDFERIDFIKKHCMAHGVTIVLKGPHTCIGTPGGMIYFNASGNPGMATAGSGDVLTGMITSLIAQNYSPEEAAILGVFLHGLAGDVALKTLGSYEGIIASDIIDAIPEAFSMINDI